MSIQELQEAFYIVLPGFIYYKLSNISIPRVHPRGWEYVLEFFWSCAVVKIVAYMAPDFPDFILDLVCENRTSTSCFVDDFVRNLIVAMILGIFVARLRNQRWWRDFISWAARKLIGKRLVGRFHMDELRRVLRESKLHAYFMNDGTVVVGILKGFDADPSHSLETLRVAAFATKRVVQWGNQVSEEIEIYRNQNDPVNSQPDFLLRWSHLLKIGPVPMDIGDKMIRKLGVGP